MGFTAMKCQKCQNRATLHITEIISDDQFEELLLCEQCGNEYLYAPQQKGAGSEQAPQGEESIGS
jgi:protein-arginine kinase activator protein McsA